VTESRLTPPVVTRRYTTCMSGSVDGLDADDTPELWVGHSQLVVENRGDPDSSHVFVDYCHLFVDRTAISPRRFTDNQQYVCNAGNGFLSVRHM
jgi:hypothetical protein